MTIGIQVTFSLYSWHIQMNFRGHSGDIVGHSGDMGLALKLHSGHIEVTFRLHSIQIDMLQFFTQFFRTLKIILTHSVFLAWLSSATLRFFGLGDH